ncbi:hypothetical protein IC235_17425 [Hymenobacter sp. BT664]|uniref:Toprim domain-containing protein n=1 Tax=Hymenobacter montanus TaxID=2771359 RepID=A0A927GKZ7_9BACT|nr:DUF6371 domain-containing protein [Hymenobacter montanus]MBD2769674.1 hypothetical protein [Hymenobacter montanus]
MPTSYRYTLQPYTGPASRYTCPGCNHRRELARYLDTETGELLPEAFGKCNRADQCGYHLSPYHAGPGGQSYADQVREANRPDGQSWTSPPVRRPAPLRPVVAMPSDVVQATLGHYEHNALAQLLRNHFGWGIADELLKRFAVGTSAHWPGACVFWLIDEQSRVRGGQVVLYDETGHTVKQPKRCTTWAHTALAARCRQLGQPAPAWLTAYSATEVPKCPCLFGLPQLLNAPADARVAIVESAKTAVFCAPYLPDCVWLATMGKSYLTADRLAPVKNRSLVLFPDAGATDDWQRRADELREQGFTVTVSTWLETKATAEQRAAGIDLADLLLSQWPGFPPSWNELDPNSKNSATKLPKTTRF